MVSGLPADVVLGGKEESLVVQSPDVQPHTRLDPLALPSVSLEETLASLHSRRDMLQVAMQHALRLGYQGAVGLLYVEAGSELQPALVGLREGVEAVTLASRHAVALSNQSLCAQALQAREMLYGRDLEELFGERHAEILGKSWESGGVMAMPFWCQERPYGVLGAWLEPGGQEPERPLLRRLQLSVQASLVRAQLVYDLAQERQRYAQTRKAWLELFELATEPACAVDPVDGRILRVNSALCNFLGYDEVALCKMYLRDIKLGEGAQAPARLILHTLEQGRLHWSETSFKRKDGRAAFGSLKARFLKGSLDFLLPPGREGVILLTIQDVTEHRAARHTIQTAYDRLSAYAEDLQRKNEEVARERSRAEEASRLKSEFLANMSHELRTPMNAIIGFTSRVLKTAEDRLNAKELRNLQIVLKNAEQLLGMITELLDYSKLDARRMDVKNERFDVYDLVEECAELTGQLVRGKDIEIRLECPHGLALVSDRGKVRQILLNLTSNAAKFTEQGSISLRARAEAATKGLPEEVVIEVVDTGRGIKQENLERIFDAFRQVDGSFTRREGGTGLGLTISSKLADLLGGRIEVSSRLGEGSCFALYCPVEPPRGRLDPALRSGG